MSTDSDIGELLGKAAKDLQRQKRTGWVKEVFVLVSAFLGAGWAARGYLAQLATKDDVAMLIRGQQEQIKSLIDGEKILSDRVATIEPLSNGAYLCCTTQAARVDHLYQLPMLVRR